MFLRNEMTGCARLALRWVDRKNAWKGVERIGSRATVANTRFFMPVNGAEVL